MIRLLQAVEVNHRLALIADGDSTAMAPADRLATATGVKPVAINRILPPLEAGTPGSE
jgi:hypothetical protein